MWKEITCPFCLGTKIKEVKKKIYFIKIPENNTNPAIDYIKCPTCNGFGIIKQKQKEMYIKNKKNRFEIMNI